MTESEKIDFKEHLILELLNGSTHLVKGSKNLEAFVDAAFKMWYVYRSEIHPTKGHDFKSFYEWVLEQRDPQRGNVVCGDYLISSDPSLPEVYPQGGCDTLISSQVISDGEHMTYSNIPIVPLPQGEEWIGGPMDPNRVSFHGWVTVPINTLKPGSKSKAEHKINIKTMIVDPWTGEFSVAGPVGGLMYSLYGKVDFVKLTVTICLNFEPIKFNLICDFGTLQEN